MKTKHLAAWVSIVASLMAVSACGDAQSGGSADPHKHSNHVDADGGHDHSEESEHNTVAVDEVYVDVPLDGIVDLADVVVRGTVVSVDERVAIGDEMLFSMFTIRPTTVFKGATEDLDLAISTHLGGQPIEIEGRVVPSVGDEVMVAAVRMAPEFGMDAFVLANSATLTLLDGDELIKAGGDTQYAEDVAAIDDAPDLAAALENAVD